MNLQHGILSRAYEEFPDPLSKDRRGGFDIHIYHFQVCHMRWLTSIHHMLIED